MSSKKTNFFIARREGPRMSFRNCLLACMVTAAGVFPASAAPVQYSANLSGADESPANASPGTGFALVTIDPVAHTLFVDVSFSGLLAGTTASHIHVINGPGDANTADTLGPVATQTPSFIGFPTGVTAGSFSNTLDTLLAATYRAGWVTDSGGSLSAAEAALFAGITEGRAYFNIHTTQFPGGEIRGFLQLQRVPEPGTVALLCLALAGLAASRRQRQH